MRSWTSCATFRRCPNSINSFGPISSLSNIEKGFWQLKHLHSWCYCVIKFEPSWIFACALEFLQLEPFYYFLQLRLFLFPITSTENDGNYDCFNGEDGFQCNIQGWGKQSSIEYPPCVHHCCISNHFDAHLALSLSLEVLQILILCNETIWNSSSTVSAENGEESSDESEMEL